MNVSCIAELFTAGLILNHRLKLKIQDEFESVIQFELAVGSSSSLDSVPGQIREDVEHVFDTQ